MQVLRNTRCLSGLNKSEGTNNRTIVQALVQSLGLIKYHVNQIKADISTKAATKRIATTAPMALFLFVSDADFE